MDVIEDINIIKNILNNKDIRFLFLVSLISSDNLIDKKDYEDSLKQINFIMDHLNELDLDDDVKKQTVEYLNKSLKIINKEIPK